MSLKARKRPHKKAKKGLHGWVGPFPRWLVRQMEFKKSRNMLWRLRQRFPSQFPSSLLPFAYEQDIHRCLVPCTVPPREGRLDLDLGRAKRGSKFASQKYHKVSKKYHRPYHLYYTGGRDIHIECSKQFKWNLYFYVSGQSWSFWAVLKLL